MWKTSMAYDKTVNKKTKMIRAYYPFQSRKINSLKKNRFFRNFQLFFSLQVNQNQTIHLNIVLWTDWKSTYLFEEKKIISINLKVITTCLYNLIICVLWHFLRYYGHLRISGFAWIRSSLNLTISTTFFLRAF